MFTNSAGHGKKSCCVLAEMLSTFAGSFCMEKNMIMRIISHALAVKMVKLCHENVMNMDK